MQHNKSTKNNQDTSIPNRHRLSKRRLRIVGLILAIVVIAGTAALIVWQRTHQQSDTSTSTAPLSTEMVKATKQSGQTLDPKIGTSAAAAAIAGNESAAASIYDTAIKANNDKDEQVALYVKKAVLQASNNDVDGAIQSAKKAEELAGVNLATASLLASLYQQRGNKVEAAKYYRTSAGLVVNDGNGSMVGTKQRYLDIATQLEASS